MFRPINIQFRVWMRLKALDKLCNRDTFVRARSKYRWVWCMGPKHGTDPILFLSSRENDLCFPIILLFFMQWSNYATESNQRLSKM